MKLVPCRWSRTGWKYVEAETKNHKFFGNPNRTNCHGYSAPDQVQQRANADFRYKQSGHDAFMTTNKHFYDNEKAPMAHPWEPVTTTGAMKGGVTK